jgi:hypothetical protein
MCIRLFHFASKIAVRNNYSKFLYLNKSRKFKKWNNEVLFWKVNRTKYTITNFIAKTEKINLPKRIDIYRGYSANNYETE